MTHRKIRFLRDEDSQSMMTVLSFGQKFNDIKNIKNMK
jgi:hypothetical protein